MAENSQQRSALKDFLASIATIKGDLSNITAPPFVLSTQSTTELPSYWSEYPSIFTAAASGESPAERALLVLKWFLLCLKRQQYGGRAESEGVKKPLNAFLGELFLATFGEGDNATTLVSEQVSHHPPVTACSLRADAAGIRADGFACQKITFNGSVNVHQMGHAVLSLTRHEESYLIPLPAVKVSGIITGTPYPELTGHYILPSSSGYVSEIDFSGKKTLGFGGEKHHVDAAVYDHKDRQKPIYSITGQWNGQMTISDSEGKQLGSFSPQDLQPTPATLPPLDSQSPYESRRAWADVSSALNKGDMQGASDAKNVLEEAQRAQRAKREARSAEQEWQPLFFRKEQRDERWEVFSHLLTEEQRKGSEENGFWVVDARNANAKRPFREGKPWEK
ncbi:hypothetical protein ANO11243_038580 [Dothideomycetidae sp. 11243]|nr:hypothetical protein ANO11243_038580 [fungal sp. No.11243]